MIFSSEFGAELQRMRRNHAVLRRDWHRATRTYDLRKFDRNQPRVPAGNRDGGQWTSTGAGQGASAGVPATIHMHEAFLGPPAIEVGIALWRIFQAGLALYVWLSARNSADRQAIITFRGREFHRNEAGGLDLENVQLLDREAVESICNLGKVQEETDTAAETVRKHPGSSMMSPTQYGTAVHWTLKQQIVNLNDPRFDFKADVSVLKSIAAANEAGYGVKNTIRIDILEKIGNQTICVYDIKTGQRGLSMPRMSEIASEVFKNYKDTQRIIVTEVRTR